MKGFNGWHLQKHVAGSNSRKRKRNASFLLVEVPKDKLDEVKAKIIELGCKVRG